VKAHDHIARRANGLEALLGGRAPRLVRWLPGIGVALGIVVGVLVWLVVKPPPTVRPT
jgi:hypothetical protein